MDNNDKEKKPTWYSLHKEQIKLLQWLLYHLKKQKMNDQPSGDQITTEEFIVKFE